MTVLVEARTSCLYLTAAQLVVRSAPAVTGGDPTPRAGLGPPPRPGPSAPGGAAAPGGFAAGHSSERGGDRGDGTLEETPKRFVGVRGRESKGWMGRGGRCERSG